MNNRFKKQGQAGKSPVSNKKNKKNKSKNRIIPDVGMSVPLHVNDVMPPRIIKDLNYVDANYLRTNAGANYLVYAFRVNDLWDPDPLILSGSVSGFREIMNFYTTYRVLTTKIHLKITNNEAFALLYGYVFSQASLVGVLANRDDAINSLETDFSTRARLLAAKGGIDTDEVQSQLKISKLLGHAQQYQAEIGYTGQGLASPTIPLFLNLIVASPSAVTLTNGVTTALTLEMRSEFFGRTNLRA